MDVHDIAQAVLFVCSATAIWLLTQPRGVLILRSRFVPRRWRNTPLPAQFLACCVGLVGQAAWFYETVTIFQPGALALTVWWAWRYFRGIITHIQQEGA